MTTTLDPTAASGADVLTSRLVALREERERTLAEVIPQGLGDAADRASNVDAEVRLAMLDQRIAVLEHEIDESRRPVARPADGTITEGDTVTLDFGDGPETLFFGTVDLAADGVEVVTPGSPLGKALVGAQVGSTVSYKTAAHRTLRATVVAIA